MLGFQIGEIFQQVRLHQRAAARDGCDHARKLNRRDGDRALADRDGNRFAGIPLVVVNALHPFFRRHQPGLFAGQVDSRGAAEPQSHGVIVNAVDAQHFADVVEEHVAGSDDRFVNVHRAVARRAPAVEHAPVEFRVAGTKGREIRGKGFGIEHRRSHHDFEHGAGRKLRLDRAIQQRRFGIGIELGPFGAGMRTAKSLGSKVGRLIIASTSPVRPSSATTAPALSAMSASAMACRS